MVNLFPYFWKRKNNYRKIPGKLKKLNIKNTIDLWLKQLISAN